MADTLKTIKCPACGKDMEKVFIPSQGINIDICTQGCGGIYFDNREFDNFDEKAEDVSKIIESLADKKFEPVDQTKERICPVCGAKMVKNSTSIRNQIDVDDCYACGGKFLDYGELDKIREEYESNVERDEDIMKFVYRHVGQDLAELEARRVEAPAKRDLAQKLFYKFMGLK